MKLLVAELMEQNENWEEILTSEPYNLKVSTKGDYVLLKYSQIGSNLSNPVVQECRGVILKETFGEWNPVCLPFHKFFNVQEPNAVQIDWESAIVEEKYDGSLIKVWFDNEWHVSTNGMIDAGDAEISSPSPIGKNFLDLFLFAAKYQCLDQNLLLKENTYLFELCSPFTKIVVYHKDTSIVHVGTRNVETGSYIDHDIGIRKPSYFSLHSEEDCILATEQLPYDEEGYVVKDKFGNFVKIKSPAYVAAHRLVSGGVTVKKVLSIIEMEESQEFLSYFPEYGFLFHNITVRINEISSDVSSIIESIEASRDAFDNDRMELVRLAKASNYPDFAFMYYDGKVEDFQEWWEKQTTQRKIKMVGE